MAHFMLASDSEASDGEASEASDSEAAPETVTAGNQVALTKDRPMSVHRISLLADKDCVRQFALMGGEWSDQTHLTHDRLASKDEARPEGGLQTMNFFLGDCRSGKTAKTKKRPREEAEDEPRVVAEVDGGAVFFRWRDAKDDMRDFLVFNEVAVLHFLANDALRFALPLHGARTLAAILDCTHEKPKAATLRKLLDGAAAQLPATMKVRPAVSVHSSDLLCVLCLLHC